MLGAFHDAEWGIARCEVEPGQQLVIVTDGIAEAQGAEGRFGEARLRAELGGTSNPAMALQRLEASLHAFTEGKLDDDVAMLAIARVSSDGPAVPKAEMWRQPARVGVSREDGDA